MNSAKNQQIEFDVFPKDTKGNYAYLSGVKSDASPETAPINVVFSHQSIIIVFIGVVMLLVASFTLGVEKGKLVSKNTVPLASTGAIAFEPAQNLIPQAPQALASASTTAPAKAVAPLNTATETTSVAETPKPEAQKAEDAPQKPLPGGFAIQVASVKSQNAAKQLADTLAKKGWNSFTKTSGEYVIVLAGNFSKREEAQNKIKELKKTYSDCFIKKI